jgi:DNA modification methylase
LILLGDCRAILPTLDAGSVRCCVTSPPYWGLRDYGVADQLGLEKTPEEYVAAIVGVFREVKRVLAEDGTLWLNLGDSYAAQRGGTNMPAETLAGGVGGLGDEDAHRGRPGGPFDKERTRHTNYQAHRFASRIGLKHKDLVGIPWRVAFALQADGWYLRSDIIWHKPNPMPESVTDRPTKSHEYVFLLSKSARYFYDADAIRERMADASEARYGYAFGGQKAEHLTAEEANGPGTRTRPIGNREYGGKHAATDPQAASRRMLASVAAARDGGAKHDNPFGAGRNARTVWTIPTQPTPDAHFATFPEALAERCILAGSAQGDTVLDPFFGSGTVGKVAERLGRKWVGIELNPAYVGIAEKKTAQRGLLISDPINAAASGT